MKKYLLLAFLSLWVGLVSGCVTQLNADIAPGSNLKSFKKFYVVRLEADHRGVEKLIADRLGVMGYQATAGERAAIPDDVDAVITYQDKWMWDITMYMLELNVQFRKPKSDIAIASGHALRTSLVRKSPPEMVEEVLSSVFNKS